jgi:hypothetical protein
MNVYRLDPIDPDHPSWQNSTEQEGLWAGASTPTDARELVADKARVGAHVADATSPWRSVRRTNILTRDYSWNLFGHPKRSNARSWRRAVSP